MLGKFDSAGNALKVGDKIKVLFAGDFGKDDWFAGMNRLINRVFEIDRPTTVGAEKYQHLIKLDCGYWVNPATVLKQPANLEESTQESGQLFTGAELDRIKALLQQELSTLETLVPCYKYCRNYKGLATIKKNIKSLAAIQHKVKHRKKYL